MSHQPHKLSNLYGKELPPVADMTHRELIGCWGKVLRQHRDRSSRTEPGDLVFINKRIDARTLRASELESFGWRDTSLTDLP